jgi:4-amino-4-deoxy-L-arabinose transferase-like glycosyltransferase
MRINKWLVVILMIAAILRLWKLDSIPPHLTSDEAALGYNAYSILKTGRDEYGKILPIIFKSFGDYKPGLYVYTTVPFVAIFGLNEFTARLPSALAGIIAVWLIYKIVNILLPEKNFSLLPFNFSLGEVAAFLLAISPWHIHFSRGAWEVNLSLTLTLAGIYFFLKSFDKPKSLILSAIFFTLTLLTYQGAKLSTFVVLVILAMTYSVEVKKLLSKNIITVVQATVIGLIIISPIILSLFQGKAGRLAVFSVFSNPRPPEYLQTFLDHGSEKVGDLSYYLFHSESNNFARGIFGRWFNHFSGRFLFFEGDWSNPRHSAPNHGVLLFADLIFLPFGIYALVSKKNKSKYFILFWMVLAPLPAILSRDQVHAVRAYNMLVPITIVSAYGLWCLLAKIEKIKSPIIHTTCYSLLIATLSGAMVYYLDAYFIHLPMHDSKYWGYGQKQVFETVVPIMDRYKSVKIQQSFDQPYIFYLFYTKYDPISYQKQAKLTESEFKGDVGYVEKIDNIKFHAIDFPRDKMDARTLVVADNIRIPDSELESENVKLLKEIKYLDGNTAFRIVEIF